MKTGRMIVGVAVLAFLVGGFLGGWLPKLKLGTGSGTGFGIGGSGGASSSDDSSRTINDNLELDSQPPEIAADLPDEGLVLHVRIDGRKYYVPGTASEGRKTYQAISLEEVISAARDRPGNDQGIRVRVSRARSSKTTAEIQLRDDLVKAGIAEEAIEWQDGPKP